MPPDRFAHFVSPKVGVIRNLAPQGRGGDEPVPPYLYTAALSHFDFRVGDKGERIAAGKGRTENDAMASAVGEALERYWDPQRTFLSKWADVQAAAISPADFVLFSERQYRQKDWPYVPWQQDAEITWLTGVELPAMQRVALPAGLIYLVHPVPRPEDAFVPSNSNGLAAGPTVEAAISGGLCELMERDALLIAWMNRLPATELDLTTAGDTAAVIHRHYARLAVEVRAFLMPTDLPAAVIMAVSFECDPGRPAQVIGMGCHPDPRIALVKALFELCQGRPAEGKRFTDNPPQGRLKTYQDVRTLDDHSAFATLPERRDEFAFLWARGTKVNVADLPNPGRGDAALDLAYCVVKLISGGHRVAYADLTLSDIAGHGFHVVRAVATGLQPVHFGHGQERLGGRRLFELPQRLGFAERVLTEADLNPCPHPLA